MNKITVFAGFIVLLSVHSWAGNSPELPDEFAINSGSAIHLMLGNNEIGTVTEEFVGRRDLYKSLRYEDASGSCLALANSRLIGRGAKVVVTDCQGNPIGALSVPQPFSIDYVLDAQNNEIATVVKDIIFGSTTVTLRQNNGSVKDAPVIAEFSQPLALGNLISSNWKATIRDHQTIDSRLIVIVAAAAL